MDRFVTFHRCLLTLVLVCVQLAIPVSATAAMFRGGVALHDICSAVASPATADPASPQDTSVLPDHASHCALCSPLTALPPQTTAHPPPNASPRGILRLGDAPQPPVACAASVPARGPPPAA